MLACRVRWPGRPAEQQPQPQRGNNSESVFATVLITFLSMAGLLKRSLKFYCGIILLLRELKIVT